ncbi:MAG: PAS domain-containing protein [Lentisphaerota bacterium]
MKKNILLDSLLHNSLSLIFFKDLNGRYINVNNSWVKHCKLDKDFTLGKTDLEIFAPDLANKYMDNDTMVKSTKQILEIEEPLNIEGINRIYFSRKFPVFNEDKDLVGTGGIAIDITEKKRMEEEIKDKEEQLITITKIIADHKEKLKAITGILPICSNCNKIRDSAGNWQEFDQYLQNHSKAQCSHSICIECAQKLYPDLKLNASVTS